MIIISRCFCMTLSMDVSLLHWIHYVYFYDTYVDFDDYDTEKHRPYIVYDIE